MRRLWRWFVANRRRREETMRVLSEGYETEARLWDRIAEMRGSGDHEEAKEAARERRREAERLRREAVRVGVRVAGRR